MRHAGAYPADLNLESRTALLETGGEYQWRREGPPHLFNPETVFRLQHATRERRYDIFKTYTQGVDDQSKDLMTLRGLLDFKIGERTPIRIDEVEPVSEIVKRFSTGAMSYGSISAGGARDPGHRHEPAGRQVQHRRGRRGRGPAAGSGAPLAPSSRSPRAASASPACT